ncbi:MAG: ATP-binding protein [Coriobacteriales bacterium]|jgi:predicted HTH transcriptional regulator|nr:ATP-binding protein [Coriobacteriales bacterium]
MISNKDTWYELFNQPNRESFREFIQTHTGEQNNLDFKKEWIEKGKLAKIVLSIGNSGGGMIVFGVEEKGGQFEYVGLSSLKNKSDAFDSIKNLIPDLLNPELQLHDLQFEGSEYEKLAGKLFQVLIIKDHPEVIPYIAKRDGDGICEGDIFTRRGTECVKANATEIEKIINRRIESQYSSSVVLDLREHLEQLQCLYASINKNITRDIDSLSKQLDALTRMEGRNPCYPSEGFDQFIKRIIDVKKKRIVEVLGL